MNRATVFDTEEIMCTISGEVIEKQVLVSEREFFIWRLEKWWVFLDRPYYYPENRIHLFRNWFWRKSKKAIKINETSKKLGI